MSYKLFIKAKIKHKHKNKTNYFGNASIYGKSSYESKKLPDKMMGPFGGKEHRQMPEL
jgi:hypothetical protein